MSSKSTFFWNRDSKMSVFFSIFHNSILLLDLCPWIFDQMDKQLFDIYFLFLENFLVNCRVNLMDVNFHGLSSAKQVPNTWPWINFWTSFYFIYQDISWILRILATGRYQIVKKTFFFVPIIILTKLVYS